MAHLNFHSTRFSADQRDAGVPDDLSPIAGKVLRLLEANEILSVAEAANALSAIRDTSKGKFTGLVHCPWRIIVRPYRSANSIQLHPHPASTSKSVLLDLAHQ